MSLEIRLVKFPPSASSRKLSCVLARSFLLLVAYSLPSFSRRLLNSVLGGQRGAKTEPLHLRPSAVGPPPRPPPPHPPSQAMAAAMAAAPRPRPSRAASNSVPRAGSERGAPLGFGDGVFRLGRSWSRGPCCPSHMIQDPCCLAT